MSYEGMPMPEDQYVENTGGGEEEDTCHMRECRRRKTLVRRKQWWLRFPCIFPRAAEGVGICEWDAEAAGRFALRVVAG